MSINFTIPPGIQEDRITINTGLWKVLPFPSTVHEFIQNSQAVDIEPNYSKVIVDVGETKLLSDLIDDLDIPSNGANVRNDWIIRGTLIVDESYVIGSNGTRQSLLSMDVYSKIIVQNGILELKGVDLVNCRNGMWDGIEVQNGGFLFMDNSKIDNAIQGIKSEPYSYLKITNSEFYNNHIAIETGAATFGGASTSDIGQFYGNKIHSDGNLLWPHAGEKTHAGLVVRDNGATIIGIASPGIDPGILVDPAMSTFEGLTNGIIATNCEMRVENTMFQNIAKTAIQIEEGSLTMENYSNPLLATFTNMETGIRASRASLSISGHEFKNVDFGIQSLFGGKRKTVIASNVIAPFNRVALELFLIEELDVIDNIVRSGSDTNEGANGMTIFNTSHDGNPKTFCGNSINMERGRVGMQFFNGLDYNVSHNGVTMGANAVNGISIEGGVGYILNDNAISNHTTDNNTKGIFISGTNSSTFSCNRSTKNETGINFFGDCIQTDFKGSNVYNNERGLTLGLLPDIGGTIIGDQDHRGNRWTGNFGNFGAYFVGLEIEAERSEFFVDPENVVFLPSTNIPGWFIAVDDMDATFFFPPPSTSGTEVCDLPGLVQEGPIEQGVDDLIATGVLVPGFTDPTTTWIFNRNLVQRLDKNYSSLDPSTANDYLHVSSGESFVILNQVATLIHEPTANLQYLENVISIQNKQTEIDNKLSALTATSRQWLAQEITDQQYSDAFSLDKGEITSLKIEQENLVNANAAIMTQRLADAQTLNNSFSSTLLPVQNEQTINNLIINGVTKEDANLLEPIALQCPLDGGAAVYTARGLLSQLGHSLNITDEENCATPQNRQVKDEIKQSNSLALFPNPANDILNIAGYTNDENAILSIYNWTGALIHQVNLEKGVINNSVNTKDWPNGIYYYTTNEKDAKTKKIVVTH